MALFGVLYIVWGSSILEICLVLWVILNTMILFLAPVVGMYIVKGVFDERIGDSWLPSVLSFIATCVIVMSFAFGKCFISCARWGLKNKEPLYSST